MVSITLLNRKNLVKIDINTDILIFKLKHVFIGKNNDQITCYFFLIVSIPWSMSSLFMCWNLSVAMII